jgi:hypothetical protein
MQHTVGEVFHHQTVLVGTSDLVAHLFTTFTMFDDRHFAIPGTEARLDGDGGVGPRNLVALAPLERDRAVEVRNGPFPGMAGSPRES